MISGFSSDLRTDDRNEALSAVDVRSEGLQESMFHVQERRVSLR